MEAIMRSLKMIIAACLLLSMAGCTAYYGPGHPYYGHPAYYRY
jgi:hypothetical protein